MNWKKMGERLIGVVVTLATSAIMFLTYSYFGSFETVAGSESKYQRLDKKLDIIICYLDKEKCIKR